MNPLQLVAYIVVGIVSLMVFLILIINFIFVSRRREGDFGKVRNAYGNPDKVEKTGYGANWNYFKDGKLHRKVVFVGNTIHEIEEHLPLDHPYTKDEIRKKFGEPTDVKQMEGGEQWNYIVPLSEVNPVRIVVFAADGYTREVMEYKKEPEKESK